MDIVDNLIKSSKSQRKTSNIFLYLGCIIIIFIMIFLVYYKVRNNSVLDKDIKPIYPKIDKYPEIYPIKKFC